MKTIHSFFYTFIFASILTSCQPFEENTRLLVADEYTTADRIYQDIQIFVEDFLANDSTFGKVTNGSKLFCEVNTTIEVEGGNPNLGGTVIIDFGSEGAVCNDGKSRTGKLELNFSGKFNKSGQTIEVTPIDFATEGFEIKSGSMLMTHGNLTVDGGRIVDVEIRKTRIKNEDLDINYFYEANLTKTLAIGAFTPSVLDDIYSFSGTAKGISSQGLSFDAVIQNDVLLEFCPFITTGLVSINVAGGKDFTLNYGEGRCDNKALYIDNAGSYSFTLR